jgi:hypothetical protein
MKPRKKNGRGSRTQQSAFCEPAPCGIWWWERLRRQPQPSTLTFQVCAGNGLSSEAFPSADEGRCRFTGSALFCLSGLERRKRGFPRHGGRATDTNRHGQKFSTYQLCGLVFTTNAHRKHIFLPRKRFPHLHDVHGACFGRRGRSMRRSWWAAEDSNDLFGGRASPYFHRFILY